MLLRKENSARLLVWIGVVGAESESEPAVQGIQCFEVRKRI